MVQGAWCTHYLMKISVKTVIPDINSCMVHTYSNVPYRLLAKVSYYTRHKGARCMVHGAWCILYCDQKSIENQRKMSETGSEARPEGPAERQDNGIYRMKAFTDEKSIENRRIISETTGNECMRLEAYCVHVPAPVGRPRGRPPNLNDSVCYVGFCCFS
jgi:hypothetical protein